MKKVGITLQVVMALLFVFYLAGCGAKADKELSDAEAALQAAREAGAAEYAPAEYQEAEELIRKAKELMAQGKHEEARALLEKARFKAIEAKGKALVAKRETERDVITDETILGKLKEGAQDGSVIGLVDVLFDYDSSDIRPDAVPVLKQNAEIIKSKAGSLRAVVVEGYCDVRGTEEYNLALGQRRAEATRAFLAGLGVSPTILEAVSKGETEQWAPGASESAYEQNRRGHFVVVVGSPQASR